MLLGVVVTGDADGDKDGHGWINGKQSTGYLPRERTIEAYDSKTNDKIMAEQLDIPHNHPTHTQVQFIARQLEEASRSSNVLALPPIGPLKASVWNHSAAGARRVSPLGRRLIRNAKTPTTDPSIRVGAYRKKSIAARRVNGKPEGPVVRHRCSSPLSVNVRRPGWCHWCVDIWNLFTWVSQSHTWAFKSHVWNKSSLDEQQATRRTHLPMPARPAIPARRMYDRRLWKIRTGNSSPPPPPLASQHPQPPGIYVGGIVGVSGEGGLVSAVCWTSWGNKRT